MLERTCINSQPAIEQILTNSYGQTFFHEIKANVNVPDNHVFGRGHMATLHYQDDQYSLTTTGFYVPEELLLDAKGNPINPLYGIESDVLVHDLRLEEMQERSYAIRFLFGWARLEGDDDVRYPTTMEFYVADKPANAPAIQSVMAICRVRPDPNWRDSVYWEGRYWNRNVDQPFHRCHLRLNVTDDTGAQFVLLWYELGARMPETNADGKLLWPEEHQKYDDFESFVQNRSRYVRTICTRLLQRREAGVNTNVPLNDLFNIDDRCENLNRRVATLRTYEGLQDLESYSVKGQVMKEYLVLPQSNKMYTVEQAERRISQFEQLVELKDTYSCCFMAMEDEIKGVCGCLHTDNVRFAEIEIPARHSLPGEKIVEAHRFAYTPQGVVDAHTWLTEEQEAFDEGLDYIEKHLRLKLTDGTLLPTNDDPADE